MTPARFVASFCGVGLIRSRAPGTWGSAAAVFVGAVLILCGGWKALLAGAVLATLAGLWAIPRAGGDADPGWVVIDEVAGTFITMLPLPFPSPLGMLAAFALFRLLDITKPGPIGRLDRIKGPVGVMGDDLVAGAIAACILWVVVRAGLP